MKYILLTAFVLFVIGCSCSEQNNTMSSMIVLTDDTNSTAHDSIVSIDSTESFDSLFGSEGSYFDTIFTDSDTSLVYTSNPYYQYDTREIGSYPKYISLKSATMYYDTLIYQDNYFDTLGLNKISRYEYDGELNKVIYYQADSIFIDSIDFVEEDKKVKTRVFFANSNDVSKVDEKDSSKVCYDTLYSSPHLFNEILMHYNSEDSTESKSFLYSSLGELASSYEELYTNELQPNFNWWYGSSQGFSFSDQNSNYYPYFIPAIYGEFDTESYSVINRIDYDTITGTIVRKNKSTQFCSLAKIELETLDSIPKSDTFIITNYLQRDSIVVYDSLIYVEKDLKNRLTHRLVFPEVTKIIFDKGLTVNLIHEYYINQDLIYSREEVVSCIYTDIRPSKPFPNILYLEKIENRITINEYDKATNLLIKTISFNREEDSESTNPSDALGHISVTKWKYEFD